MAMLLFGIFLVPRALYTFSSDLLLPLDILLCRAAVDMYCVFIPRTIGWQCDSYYA